MNLFVVIPGRPYIFYHSKNAEKCGSFELLRLPLCLVEEDGARRNTLDFFYIVQQVG